MNKIKITSLEMKEIKIGENEPLERISKSLFTASEALREALDTADLESVDLGNWKAFLEGTHKLLELKAQEMQKKAREEGK